MVPDYLGCDFFVGFHKLSVYLVDFCLKGIQVSIKDSYIFPGAILTACGDIPFLGLAFALGGYLHALAIDRDTDLDGKVSTDIVTASFQIKKQ